MEVCRRGEAGATHFADDLTLSDMVADLHSHRILAHIQVRSRKSAAVIDQNVIGLLSWIPFRVAIEFAIVSSNHGSVGSCKDIDTSVHRGKVWQHVIDAAVPVDTAPSVL